MKRYLRKITAAALLLCMLTCLFLGEGAFTVTRAAGETLQPDAAGDGDVYHVMHPAQGAGISGNLFAGQTYTAWGDGYTRETLRRHDGTTGSVYKVVNGDKDAQAGFYLPASASTMLPGSYTLSAWSKAENVVEHGGVYFSYSIVAMLSYADGRNANYSAEFTQGTHDWEFRDVSFVVDSRLSSVQIFAFLRTPCTGTVWFDELSLVRSTDTSSTFHDAPVQVLQTAPAQATKATLKTKDGLELGLGDSLVTSLKVGGRELANNAYSGFLARDIARTDGVYAFAPAAGSTPVAFKGNQATLGLNIEAKYEAKDDHIAVSGTLRENVNSADGRAVALSYALPVTASGWRWGDDIQTSRAVTVGEGKDVFKRLGEFRLEAAADWETEAHSVYPMSTIYNDDLGIAIAVSLDFPTYWELEYNGSTHQYVLTYHLGVVKEAPDAARFSFVIYKLNDPAWGFRAAVKKYAEIFPEYYEVRETDQGLWLGPQDVDYSSIPDIEDFNIRYNEESRDRNVDYLRYQGAKEIDRNIKGFQYIESSGFWIAGDQADLTNPTNAKVQQALTNLSQSNLPTQKFLRQMAEAYFNNGGVKNAAGDIAWTPVNVAWSPNGVRLGTNFNPNLPEPNYWSVYLTDRQWNVLFDESASVKLPFDGIYLDELSGWNNCNGNFAKEQYRYTTVPLTYSPLYKKPMLHVSATNWEWVKKLSDKLHAQGKTILSNKSAEKYGFNFPLIDILGTEWWGWDGSSYHQCSLQQMSQYRTLAYQKPFCILLSCDYSDGKFDAAQLERYLQYCLLFGIFPSPWDNSGATNQRYWDNPALYERDRPVWKKYSPVLKTVAEAGWEPVTYATDNNANVLMERYGDTAAEGVYFTVHNTASTTQTVTVTIPADKFAGSKTTAYTELLSGKTYTLRDGACTLTLEPYQTVVLAMEKEETEFRASTMAGAILDEIADTDSTDEWLVPEGDYSPWTAQTKIYNGTGRWETVSSVRRESFAGMHMAAQESAGNYGHKIGIMDKYQDVGVFGLMPYCEYEDHCQTSAVALTFTTPTKGLYRFSADDLDAEQAGVFVNHPDKEFDRVGVAAGVRITQNDRVVWPADGQWFRLEAGAGVPIPTLEMELEYGDLVRVEVTALEKAEFDRSITVTASAKMTCVYAKGTVFSTKTLASRVMGEAERGTEEWTALQGDYAPWAMQLCDFSGWQNVTGVRKEWAGANGTTVAGGLEHQVGVERDAMGVFRLAPYCQYAYLVGVAKAGLTFMAPVGGTYRFSPADVLSDDGRHFTNYNDKDEHRAGTKAGVRITKNDEVVWPATGDWFELAVGASVPIPTMTLELAIGDVVRVEATALEVAEGARCMTVTASAQMTYLGEGYPLDFLGCQVRDQDVYGNVALRFGFRLKAAGVAYASDDPVTTGNYSRDLTAATVRIDDVTYKVVDFGAVLSLDATDPLTLESSRREDGLSTVVPAANLYDVAEGTTTFTAVVTAIPSAHRQTPIYARAYLQYVDEAGETRCLYGDKVSRSAYQSLAGTAGQ